MGGETKVTVMVLKVDLQCDKCYKKVKKVLCKFPQIRDQVYDDKANTVTIRVVCCSPEKIRDKMCSKGGGSIQSIEIKDPVKPKEAEKKPDNKPKEAEKKPDNKPKEAEKKPDNKPKEAEKKPDKPKEPEKKPEKQKDPEKKPEKPKDGGEKPKDAPKQAGDQAPKKPAEHAPVPMAAAVMTAVPSAYAAPVGCSCSDCYHSYGGGGQCFQAAAYGTPVTYGRPVYDSWGSGGYYPYRAPTYGGGGGGEYVTEENQQGGCSIM